MLKVLLDSVGVVALIERRGRGTSKSRLKKQKVKELDLEERDLREPKNNDNFVV